MPSRPQWNSVGLRDTENVGILWIFASDRGLTILAIDSRGFSFSCRHSLGALEDVKVFLLGFSLI